jgi:DNA-binding NtrC family response regulator
MQKGAFHYLAKPFQLNELRMVVRRALDAARLQRENVSLRRELEHYTPPEEIIGDNPALRHVLDAVNRIAPTESPVLVCGETGTGKELMARRIHRLSLRADRSFVTVNCAALPDALLESELFGHVKGAFTGARDSRDGLFLAADGGTLFMDEIGDVGPTAQARLLRVLESGEIRRVGEDACRYTDVRLIAATNRDLQEDVRNGAFRDDLYHRINVITLTMPPLRRRRTDIPVLAEHFARLTARLDRQEFAGFDEDVLRAFQQYDWPGNVRELLNVVRRAVILSGGRRVGAHELPAGLRAAAGGDADAPGTQPEGESLEAVERQHIIDVLRSTGGNKSRAAEILGISRPTLRAKLARYAISPKDSL